MLRKKNGYKCVSHVECVAIVQPAGVQIRVNVAAEKGDQYPRGCRLQIDRVPDVLVKSVVMTSMQTVPCHIAGMGTVSCFKTVR